MTSHEPRKSAGAVPVLAPRGEVDIDALPPLQAEALIALTRHGALIIDASGIEFADSSFLHMLVALHHQGDLRIANPSYSVQRLMHMVGADTLLSLYPTLEAARQASHT
ncbi:STAS domain-containing protein [Streptomyces sp. NPDC086838]|uniref:STAS domain-containing protein n=1 Tax=Streptomyces sp. NPDC086838 TaxID=3365762 RepID=UPI00380F7526